MKLLWPVSSDYPITQTFAEHVHNARINGWSNYNGGVDWAVPTGTPIVAAQAYQVTNHIVTAAGRETDQTILIVVQER